MDGEKSKKEMEIVSSRNITDSRDYNIIYEVTDGNRKFYDKINKIKIEVKSI